MIEILLFILFILIIYAFYKIRSKWISSIKKIEGQNSIVKIKIHTNLDSISFSDFDGKENYSFERKNLKKGENIEFSYPCSKNDIFICAIKNKEEKKFRVQLSS